MSSPNPTSQRDDAYQAWRTAVAAVAELLLLGNSDEQFVYADIAGPESWDSNAMTIFVGSYDMESGYRKDIEPRLRIGDMTALWVWDGHIDAKAPEAQRVWEELWPEARTQEPTAIAERLAGHIGLKLGPPQVDPIERRWGEVWARIGTAAGASLGAAGGARLADGGADAVAGAIAGAVAGGAVGSSAERGATREPAYEYVVATSNGALLTLVQGGAPMGIGERIIVLYGSPARIIIDQSDLQN